MQSQSKMTLPASLYTSGQRTTGKHRGKREYRATVGQCGCAWWGVVITWSCYLVKVKNVFFVSISTGFGGGTGRKVMSQLCLKGAAYKHERQNGEKGK